MKVLALTRYGRLGASSRLRSYQYQEPLAQHGIQFHIAPLFGDDYVRALYGRSGRVGHAVKAFSRRLRDLLTARQYDAVWVEKEALPWVPAFVELSLLPRKTKLIVDIDDAVFHRYDCHRSAIVRSVLGRKIDRVMARSDLVVAGNEYLADRAQKAGVRRVEIVPTVVDLGRYVMRPRPPGELVTVGWIGSPNTAGYLDIVKPALEDLSRTIPLRALAIGARPDQVAGSRFEAVAWSEATEVEQISRFDIGIMPLPDSPFERGKCGYKLIQYMAMGMPVVASPVGANKTIVRSGVDGLFATESADWLSALTALCRSQQERQSMGASGRKRVEEHYDLAGSAQRLADMLTS